MKNHRLWKQVLTMFVSLLLACGLSVSVSAKSSSDKKSKDEGHSTKKDKKHKHADETPAAAAAPTATVADPKTDAIVHDISTYYGDLKSMKCRLIQKLNASSDTKTVELLSVVDVDVKKPDKIAVILKAGMPGGSLMCDGKNAYFYSQILNRYIVKPEPDDFEKLFTDANSRYVNGPYAMFSLLPSLLAKDPYTSIMAGVQKTEYIGTEDVDGVSCHHMRFTQDKFFWDLWVDAGKHPFIVKVAPDLFSDTAATRTPGRTIARSAKMSLSFRYKNWLADPSIKSKAFTFVPPPESSEGKTFAPQATAEEETGGAESKSPLIGKAAPGFKLSTIGGSDIDLASQKNNNIVVLDFWASWCPDCQAGLPIVTKVTNAFKDKHVVFYAVNQGEDSEKIKKFLKERNLDVTTLLDTDKKVAKSYRVIGIPQTVIIDKNGIVQSVDLRFSKELEQALTSELDKLTAH